MSPNQPVDGLSNINKLLVDTFQAPVPTPAAFVQAVNAQVKSFLANLVSHSKDKATTSAAGYPTSLFRPCDIISGLSRFLNENPNLQLANLELYTVLNEAVTELRAISDSKSKQDTENGSATGNLSGDIAANILKDYLTRMALLQFVNVPLAPSFQFPAFPFPGLQFPAFVVPESQTSSFQASDPRLPILHASRFSASNPQVTGPQVTGSQAISPHVTAPQALNTQGSGSQVSAAQTIPGPSPNPSPPASETSANENPAIPQPVVLPRIISISNLLEPQNRGAIKSNQEQPSLKRKRACGEADTVKNQSNTSSQSVLAPPSIPRKDLNEMIQNPAMILERQEDLESAYENLSCTGVVTYPLRLPSRHTTPRLEKLPHPYDNAHIRLPPVPQMLMNPTIFQRFINSWNLSKAYLYELSKFIDSGLIKNQEIFSESVGVGPAPPKSMPSWSADDEEPSLGAMLDAHSPLFKETNGAIHCPDPSCELFDAQFLSEGAFQVHVYSTHHTSVNCSICSAKLSRYDAAKRHTEYFHDDSALHQTVLERKNGIKRLAARGFATLTETLEGRIERVIANATKFGKKKQKLEPSSRRLRRDYTANDESQIAKPWLSFKRVEEEVNRDINIAYHVGENKMRMRDLLESNSMC